MTYIPENIIWIKHVTNQSGGTAYMNFDNEFVIHVPNKHRTNLLQPQIGDLIVLYQNINGVSCFTHLVTPKDQEEKTEPRAQYMYGRMVSVIAKTDILSAIPRALIGWDQVDFRGISQGNFCELSHIGNIVTEEQMNRLKSRLWQAFEPHFNVEYLESIRNLKSAEDEVDIDSEDSGVREGDAKLIWHLARERDKSIVKEKKSRAIADGQLNCEVCNFSFQKKFDVDFIECHHRTPINEGGRITKLSDLALVCANCHRMLHKHIDGEYLSVEKLQSKFY